MDGLPSFIAVGGDGGGVVATSGGMALFYLFHSVVGELCEWLSAGIAAIAAVTVAAYVVFLAVAVAISSVDQH